MLNALKNLVKSRKFWMTIVGSIIVTVMNQIGVEHSIIMTIAGLFGVNIAGIAIEDSKKQQ